MSARLPVWPPSPFGHCGFWQYPLSGVPCPSTCLYTAGRFSSSHNRNRLPEPSLAVLSPSTCAQYFSEQSGEQRRLSIELCGLSIFRPHHRQRSWPNRTVSMHLIEQWIPGKAGTRYPPSLQIDMPQPSQLPRGDPTLPAGRCRSLSNEFVVAVRFITSPKASLPLAYLFRIAFKLAVDQGHRKA